MWRPNEVDEIKIECFISNSFISGSQKPISFNHEKIVSLKCINLSPMTLYIVYKHKGRILQVQKCQVLNLLFSRRWNISFMVISNNTLANIIKKVLVVFHIFEANNMFKPDAPDYIPTTYSDKFHGRRKVWKSLWGRKVFTALNLVYKLDWNINYLIWNEEK